MAFSFKQRLAAIKEARRVQNYFNSISREERGDLVVHTATAWENYGFTQPASVEQAVAFLLTCNLDEIKSIHQNSKDEKTKKQAAETSGKLMSLTIPDGYSASQAMIVLRDIKDSEKINLIVLDVDSGDYIPINPRLIAQLLVTAAENMITKQNEIEQAAQGH